MKDIETTNFLLLLILFVLLAGFGFLAPILWIVGAALGVWISAIVLRTVSRTISSGLDAIGNFLNRLFAPIWKGIRLFFGNSAVQWSLLAAASCLLLWYYFESENVEYLSALMIPALFALVKAINYWDTVSIRRKYARSDANDVGRHSQQDDA